MQGLELQWRIGGHDVGVILCGNWRQELAFS